MVVGEGGMRKALKQKKVPNHGCFQGEEKGKGTIRVKGRGREK